MFEMTKQMVGEYTGIEAWVYDHFIAPGIGPFFSQIIDRLDTEIPNGASLLDVGCGGGQLLLYLACRRPDLTLTGLDLNPGQIRRASMRARKGGRNIRFEQGSALDLPFAARSFDTVVSVASIKHWPDQARGLSEIARVLKPQAPFFVIEADRGCDIDDCRRFVSGMRLPGPLQEVATAAFRTYVAGQSLDLEDARALLKTVVAATGKEVARIPGAPALMLRGFSR